MTRSIIVSSLDSGVGAVRSRRFSPNRPLAQRFELQSVIDLLGERVKLEASQPAARQVAKVATMLPNAAEIYREQIGLGLEGDPRAALKARSILRKLCGSIVVESDEDGSVWARFELQPAALLAQAAVTVGRGDRI